ncbi:MAG: hypothetical protein KAI66_27810, partial [Lentisphaeria bacterium]|nr:hypothetical protein [Lentisphaeria bacterium]
KKDAAADAAYRKAFPVHKPTLVFAIASAVLALVTICTAGVSFSNGLTTSGVILAAEGALFTVAGIALLVMLRG